MAVLKVDSDNIKSEVFESKKTVLLDFWADWCAPCRMLSPVVEEVAGEREDILIGKVNVDEQPHLAEVFGVQSIPLLVLVQNGEIVKQSVGYLSKEQLTDFIGK